MAMTEQQAILGAFKRAAGRRAAVRFVGTSNGGYAVYAVGSSEDVDRSYRVTVDPDGVFRCTCPSELRPACWHRAAVHLTRIQRMAGGLAADGPTLCQGLIA
jgi:uncharacterized Zn finger protein